jgi:tRNA-modifying protein YgfZ
VALDPIYTRGVVRIAGADAGKLLADTLTCRFEESLSGTGRWFALLSPQGKVQVEGLVTFAEDAFWFDLDTGSVADFVKRMKLYRLRAKVEIEAVERLVLWSGDDRAAADGIGYRDERSDALGTRRIVAKTPDIAPNEDALLAYHSGRIAQGVPEMGADFDANEVFAHDIGLDLLGGIDFIKGCYIGQEVVSRMKHRGTARRRPVIVAGIEAATGTPILAGGREAGVIGMPIGGKAVAIIRLDRVTDLGAVTVGDKPVRLSMPGWASYDFGEAPTEVPAAD